MRTTGENSRILKSVGTENRHQVLFAPLKTRRAFEEISAEIKRLIFSGTLKPGDGLPSEGELAGQFGVSRQTVREALRRLELSGFIAVQKGASGGPVVVDTILKSIGDLFLDAFQLKKMTTTDLTRARVDIEKMILKNVFEANDKETFALMRATERETGRKLTEGIPAFGDNLDFHILMARATGNYMFVILMESMMTVVAHFHSVLRIGTNTIRSAHRAHERILDAIEEGDEPRAQAELEKHILAVDRLYRKVKKRSQTE
jgi:DNA-binding FadR family transcriptional regulator